MVKSEFCVRKSFPTEAIRKGERRNLVDLPVPAYSCFTEGFAPAGLKEAAALRKELRRAPRDVTAY